jgi:hypothetical protein
MLMTGAHEHDVARQHLDASRAVEIGRSDRVVVFEMVDAVQARDVEEHSPAHDRSVLLDTELGGAAVA